MKIKHVVIIISLLIAGLPFYTAPTSAEGIKQRMKERLPIILELKAKGIVGEDASGYLEFIGPKKEKEKVVKAENSDRREVYEAIAKQQGTTAQLVGRRRAIQISENASPGDWLQDQNGKWYQKK
jgi:uncharacterized protein YdbL (DUF1318 family)